MLASIMQTSFSIVVAVYLLIRMEKRMDELTVAVDNLTFVIAGCSSSARSINRNDVIEEGLISTDFKTRTWNGGF